MVGYLIGVPVVVLMSIVQLSLMNHVLLSYGQSIEIDAQIGVQVSLSLYFFQIINDVFGPLFIIVLGTTMMAWAALHAMILPKWFCYMGMIIGLVMAISFLGLINPTLRVLGTVAPLHMIWFVLLGVFLLRRAKAESIT